MSALKPGTVWVRRPSVLDLSSEVPVTVLTADALNVVCTSHNGGDGRDCHPVASFRFLYQPAPKPGERALFGQGADWGDR